jgi:hypothetical protein
LHQFRILFFLLGVQPLLELIENNQYLLAWQVAEQIHKLCAPKRPLLVAISGYGTLEDHIRSKEAGIDLHLIKPADMAALEKLLQRFQEVILPAAGEAPAAP